MKHRHTPTPIFLLSMEINHFWLYLLLFHGCCSVGFCDPQGFLSLSCGGKTTYIDSSNISWVPDDEYVTTGKITSVTDTPIRFFPTPLGRSCYQLPLNKNISSLALIRSQFVYNNYDGQEKPPIFSVSLGTAVASKVNLKIKDPWTEEFVWLVTKDSLSFCLIATPNGGSPVISSIEIRPLPSGAYRTALGNQPSTSLRKVRRIDSGHANNSLRYPLDPYDRIWDPDCGFTPFHVSTSFKTQSTFNLREVPENLPAAVLETARVLARGQLLTYSFPLDVLGDYYVVLYFAGMLPVSPSFDILINGDVVQSNYTVKASQASALHFIQKKVRTLNVTLKSTSFFPQINGIEVYGILDVIEEASSTTVSALEVIQQFIGLDLGWKDDPCSPIPWDHIGCEGSHVASLDLSGITLRSINPAFGDLLDLKTLDLHNTSLAGEILNLGGLKKLEKLNLSFNALTSFGSDMETLRSLQILDLQNNSLEGTVPDSFGEMKDLHSLNLENNLLKGPLPQSLNRESLEVRTSGNLCLAFSDTCYESNNAPSNPSIESPQLTVIPNKKKHINHNHLAFILGVAAGILLAVLFISLITFMIRKRQRNEAATDTSRAEADIRNWNAAKIFSYKEIKSATKNFKEVIGRGSFGSVFLGKLQNGKLVAVKVRSDKSQLGTDSFINEVHLLSQIRHQNLVSFEGFCSEAQRQILVYEYLAGGSLADHLYGPNSRRVTLSWVMRLKLAVDAAKGLDYLHTGSNPRIIHRDVKCSNILLDKNMNAKVCDFGLSKQVTREDASHVTTVVKGTAGYLDPEYYSTQQLTEKSDVYSFGVVLLELICGREPLNRSGAPDSFNLVLWAKPYLQAGALEIVDERLEGEFEVESMKKAAIVAVRSVERDASRRPSMTNVLAQLKEAYNIQLASSGRTC